MGRNDEAGNDGGVEALLGAGVGGNGNGHGKRKGNNGNRQAGYGVAVKALKAVPLAQGRHEFWGEFVAGRFFWLQDFRHGLSPNEENQMQQVSPKSRGVVQMYNPSLRLKAIVLNPHSVTKI